MWVPEDPSQQPDGVLMTQYLKIGLWTGFFGLFIVALFGEKSAIMAGLLVGVIAGLLERARSGGSPLGVAARNGTIVGALASAGVLLGMLIRASALDSMAGVRPLTLVDNLGVAALAVALGVGISAWLSASAALKGRTGDTAMWATLGVIILIYPFLDSQIGLGWIGTVIVSLIYILLALGLNVVVGYAGLLDLGYAAFFAIGAYTNALLNSTHLHNQIPGYTFQMSFWIVIWVSAAMAAIFGLILGAPTLPLRGDYLAIVTLGFGEIVPIVFKNLDHLTIKIGSYTLLDDMNVTGGEPGISPIGPPTFPGVNFADRSNQIPWYLLLIAIILLSVFLIGRLRDSRLGRAWMAMREDELAAASMGIDIVRTKLLAFSMGAMFSGFGGAYYASYVSGAFPSSFDFSVSVIVLCMVILGGLGNISGVIVGGLIIELSDRLFLPELSVLIQKIANNTNSDLLKRVNPNDYRLLLFGLVLVLMMQLRPEGLLPNARRRAELHASEEDADIAAQERNSIQDPEAA
jgi:branched-chain amino acid transport system permease protein